MLRINLLPPAMRKKDGFTPIQLVVLAALLALVGLLGFSIREFSIVVIPRLEADRAGLVSRRDGLLGELTQARSHADSERSAASTVAALHCAVADGPQWARALQQVKDAVNTVPTRLDGGAPAGSALWLSRLGGSSADANIIGYAMAANRADAPLLAQTLVDSLRLGENDAARPRLDDGMWTGAPEPLRNIGTERESRRLWNFHIIASMAEQ